jgi:serine/threonine protein phosphatase PrpC
MSDEPRSQAGLELLYAARSVRGRRDRLQDNYLCTREVVSRAEGATAWAEVAALDASGAAAAAVPELVDFPMSSELSGVRLFALADGVGGHNRGDLAAAEAVRLLPLFYQPERLRAALEADIARHGLAGKGPLEGLERLPQPERIGALLRAVYQRINVHLHFHEVPDIRTTLVTLALDGPRTYLANVGDSRVYRLPREGALGLRPAERLTVDDSFLDRRIYEGEYLPFAPCSYEVAPELREHLEAEGRYSLEFIFDLTRLDGAEAGESFDALAQQAHEEIGRILSDGSTRAYRRAMQLGTIAPAYQIKDEGLLRVLGHQEWLAEDEIRCTVRQGRRRVRPAAAEPRWLELGAGDLLLLCSDGLTDVLPESRIHQVLSSRLGEQPATSADELSAACAELVALAEKDEACLDNVSAVLVQAAVSADQLRRGDTGRLGRAAIQRRAAEPLRPSVAEAARSCAAEVPRMAATEAPRPFSIEAAEHLRRPAEPERPGAERAEPDRAGPDRSAARLLQALMEKKTMDREVLSVLRRLDERLGEADERIEEVRLALAELRGRLGGLARRTEMLDRLAWLPLLTTLAVMLLLLVVLLQFTR